MNLNKIVFAPVLLCSLSVISASAFSQVNEMTEGVVRKIDLQNSKVTIRHEEIKSLDMPPMTMVFQVRSKALLDKIQVGQAVKFTVVQDSGKLVITDLKPTP